MPQIQLPIFPAGSTPITAELAFEQREGTVFYFNGHLPVFSHPLDDLAFFRFFTSQLISNGNASQGQIARAFGLALISVKRACKKLRTEGAAAFFRPGPPRQGHKLTAELLARAQALLDERQEVPAIGAELGVISPTPCTKLSVTGGLKKDSGALVLSAPAAATASAAPTTQSARTVVDGEAPMAWALPVPWSVSPLLSGNWSRRSHCLSLPMTSAAS